MNSQQDQSQIAQQNIVPILQQNTRKYIKFHDIYRYQSLKMESNIKNHECRPIYINWNQQKSHQNHSPYLNRISPIQWVIEHELNQCCLNYKLNLTFGLRKHNFIEIAKIRKLLINNNVLFDEEGIRYRIQHGVSNFRIQVSITKDRSNKLWKQIQIPIKSFQPQLINALKIHQNLNGDILLTFNQFQFMFNLKMDNKKGQFLTIRGDINLLNLKFEQMTQLINENGPSCSQGKCLIF